MKNNFSNNSLNIFIIFVQNVVRLISLKAFEIDWQYVRPSYRIQSASVFQTLHCPVPCIRTGAVTSTTKEWTVDHDATIEAKPYEDIPGPKPVPILGNTWRLFPVIGQYQISDVAKLSQIFYDEYGKIVRLTGLIGRPDLLFVYDADEIEKIYRQEGPTPFRPSMPCLVHYKSVVRKDFFGSLPGVVGVYVDMIL